MLARVGASKPRRVRVTEKQIQMVGRRSVVYAPTGPVAGYRSGVAPTGLRHPVFRPDSRSHFRCPRALMRYRLTCVYAAVVGDGAQAEHQFEHGLKDNVMFWTGRIVSTVDY